jgi:chromosomal replication initiator protein
VNLTQIWQATLGTMQMQTSRQEFDTWLRGTTLLSLESGVATVGTVSAFYKEGLENRYLAPMRHSLGDIVGYPVQIRVVIANQNPRPEAVTPTNSARNGTETEAVADSQSASNEQSHSETKSEPKAEQHSPESNGQADNGSQAVRAPAQMPSRPIPSAAQASSDASDDKNSLVQLDLNSAMRSGMLIAKYTFDRFIVGSSNRLAHAASSAVAENPANAYNPLFLYGGVGLGKTHLLHAIGNYALDRDPEINVLYVSSEKFTNDLINAIRRQQTEEFRLRYRNIDILMIDDIQFIAGKDATQEEFFHTFNTLHSAAKQIVISSDRPPKAIVTLEERLRSRFEWGLIVDVQSPDLETRTAILRAKGEQMGRAFPPEVIDFLAHKVQSNIRELEGSLNRVAAFADLQGLPVTVDLAAASLAELFENSHRKHVTPEVIMQTVANYYSVDLKLIQGRGRSRNIVVPRQVTMYLLREETDLSLMDIGTLLGGRDHTTVMYGCEKMSEEINSDARLRADVNAIRERLFSSGD